MRTSMIETIDQDMQTVIGDKPHVEMRAVALQLGLGNVRMIDRVEAIRLISRYNGHVSILDQPDRYSLHAPVELDSFIEQVNWLVDQTVCRDDNPRHWALPEIIEGGIRLFVYDFTYIEITKIAMQEVPRYDVRIFSITGGERKVASMANLLGAVIGAKSWLDNPDLSKMISSFGV